MMMFPVIFLSSLLILPPFIEAWTILPATSALAIFQSLPLRRNEYDYDFVIIGAGASGLFAAGTASSLGLKTLLVERAHSGESNGGAPRVELEVGGDCTNAACVPSKAVRSIAKMAASCDSNRSDREGHSRNTWLKLARQQANDAVGKVRAREDPSRIGDVPNLELEFVEDCHFVSSHKLRLMCYDNSTWLQRKNCSVADSYSCQEKVISSKKFLIATGASPILPHTLTEAATKAGVPYVTYRSLLRPGSCESLLNESVKNIVIGGGGATACELEQSLSWLGGNDLNLSIVSTKILPNGGVTEVLKYILWV